MRELSKVELKKVSGGKTNWDAYNAKHGITGPINGYGNMPHPPNMSDFSAAVGEGAVWGLYVAGPIGAVEGAAAGAGVYAVSNAFYNARDYWF